MTQNDSLYFKDFIKTCIEYVLKLNISSINIKETVYKPAGVNVHNKLLLVRQ